MQSMVAEAKALIEAGAYVVVTGRRQTELDRAKKLLGKNATTILGSADKCD
jgi:NADP-dependent 3-hydroxy acid dehydrogenase YdfG